MRFSPLTFIFFRFYLKVAGGCRLLLVCSGLKRNPKLDMYFVEPPKKYLWKDQLPLM
jgi:hypothetical protein